MPDSEMDSSLALDGPPPAQAEPASSAPAAPAVPDWFQAAVSRWERPVIRYAITLCGDAETARDAAQDTFVRLFRQRPSGETEELGAWLFTVCRNRLTDLRRKNHRLVPMTAATASMADLADDSPASAPSAALEAKEERSQLRQLISGLPARQQELVRLKFEAGLSYREIAAATGLSTGNVGYLLHHAVQALRSAWSAANA